jgi:hypothetical protein
VITDFTGNDMVYLAGYGAGAASAALNGAQQGGGAVTLTLSDNAQITFLDISSVSALAGHIVST